jgi:hypothetical protein
MKTILYILIFLLVSALVYLGFYNAFYQPKVTLNYEGNETVVYLEVNDRYQLTDSVMKLVFNELYEKHGIVITKGFAIHKPLPEDAERKITTLIAGCIVEAEDTAKLSQISETFTIAILPADDYLISDFPLKGKMSIMFGLYRVYPKLDAFCKKQGYSSLEPVIEIYDRKSKRIHYRKKAIKS